MSHVSSHDLGDLLRGSAPSGESWACGTCGSYPYEFGCSTERCRYTCGDCPPGTCGSGCDALPSTSDLACVTE